MPLHHVSFDVHLVCRFFDVVVLSRHMYLLTNGVQFLTIQSDHFVTMMLHSRGASAHEGALLLYAFGFIQALGAGI